jgi:hypothetical protein
MRNSSGYPLQNRFNSYLSTLKTPGIFRKSHTCTFFFINISVYFAILAYAQRLFWSRLGRRAVDGTNSDLRPMACCNISSVKASGPPARAAIIKTSSQHHEYLFHALNLDLPNINKTLSSRYTPSVPCSRQLLSSFLYTSIFTFHGLSHFK